MDECIEPVFFYNLENNELQKNENNSKKNKKENESNNLNESAMNINLLEIHKQRPEFSETIFQRQKRKINNMMKIYKNDNSLIIKNAAKMKDLK